MGNSARVSSALTVLLLVACGDDEAGPPPADGAVPGDGSIPDMPIPWLDDGAPAIAPPAPVTAACPDGWREVVGDDATTCEPYPAEEPAACGDGEAHFPGEPACTRIGAPCPTGLYADGLPSDVTVVHLSPGATGGDGSAALPYGAFGEFSLSRLPSGTVLALSKGTFDDPVRTPANLVLQGACATETILTATAPDLLDGIVTVRGSGVVLRDLALAGGVRPAVYIEGDGFEVSLEGVIISDLPGYGVRILERSSATVSSVLIRDVRQTVPKAVGGHAFHAVRGADITVSRTVVERSEETAIQIRDGGATVTLDGVAIRDTLSDSLTLRGGSGANVDAGMLTARACSFEGNRAAGVVLHPNATASLEDTLVRGTLPAQARTADGLGLRAEGDGAMATLRRTLFDANHFAGVLFARATASLEDVVIRGTRTAITTGDLGRGLSLNEGATATVTRAHLTANHESGIGVEAAATLVMEDVSVTDTEPEEDGQFGRALGMAYGATVTARRFVAERSREVAVTVQLEGTSLRLEDAVVRDTGPEQATMELGQGVQVMRGAHATLERVLVERALSVGVLVTERATATFADVAVRDVESRPSDLRAGRGLGVQLGSTATGERVLLDGLRDVGLFVGEGSGQAASVELAGLVVRDVRPRACVDSTCADSGFGVGAGAYGDAAMVLTGFQLERADLCGVHLSRGASVDLTSGLVSGSSIGACVQVDPYDTARLTAGVVYVDNGVNLQSTMLPVPELSRTLAE